eukprot:CAMPEP_0184665412 /NCGR_PEP_ID=MMETSP0308-20130426/57147_1 /TAXON_ID=38269 /ORGANISM="Gloeochaete witrockiana, Strain SAG 46.84" /LENGTH=149 /DNA_ID=CAMNT_0027109401 /DNA_START=377 /DNA_END=829 /DNA_ORIENTATION=+
MTTENEQHSPYYSVEINQEAGWEGRLQKGIIATEIAMKRQAPVLNRLRKLMTSVRKKCVLGYGIYNITCIKPHHTTGYIGPIAAPYYWDPSTRTFNQPINQEAGEAGRVQKGMIATEIANGKTDDGWMDGLMNVQVSYDESDRIDLISN